MRRSLVAVLAVLVLSLGACADNGSSSGSGTSSGSSDGSSSNGSSSDNGSSSNGSSSGGGGTDDGGTGNQGGGSTPTTSGEFTLPEPRSDGTVEVPEDPPEEIRDESPIERLRAMPPVPRYCLDPDLTLLDVFVPGAAIPVRLLQCLIYVGTIARVPSNTNGGSSSADVERAQTSNDAGDPIVVQLVRPNRVQRPLLTLALLFLIVAISITIGYVLGRRNRAPA